mgnify:CR=1 FL=1
MLDIKFLRENPDLVKENIKKKFQDQKLPLVDEVIVKDRELRTMKQRVDDVVGKVIEVTVSAVEDTEESNTADDAE